MKQKHNYLLEYPPGSKCGVFKVISYHGNMNVLVECIHCKLLSYKRRNHMINFGCSRCKKLNQAKHRDLTCLAWIYGLNENTIRTRLQRGWTMNEALGIEIHYKDKEFSIDDLEYISKDLEINYEANKELETKVISKFKYGF